MENKGRYDALLTKYLTGELTRREQARLQDWLRQDEKHRQELETLKMMWGVLQISDTPQSATTSAEWLALKTRLGEKEGKVISMMTGKMTAPESRPPAIQKVSRVWRSIATTAAVVLIVLSAGWVAYHLQQQQIRVPLAAAGQGPAEPGSIKREVNRSDKAKTVLLEDGSTVVLFANSELSYRSKFLTDKREIVLTGKARFAVAADPKRSFVVYADDIRTVDIGTVFTVTAYSNKDDLTVEVAEGKVRVGSVDAQNPAFEKEILLNAGERMVYDRRNKTVRHNQLNDAARPVKDNAVTQKAKRNKPDIPKGFRSSWFMFNNQPLSEIFRSLEQMYNVKIRYDAADIKNAYFIGRFNKSDSLPTILQRMALLNELIITKEAEDTFTVKRK
jgi:ferric-dicitrate binding protein FerR (iron transport regulator)